MTNKKQGELKKEPLSYCEGIITVYHYASQYFYASIFYVYASKKILYALSFLYVAFIDPKSIKNYALLQKWFIQLISCCNRILRWNLILILQTGRKRKKVKSNAVSDKTSEKKSLYTLSYCSSMLHMFSYKNELQHSFRGREGRGFYRGARILVFVFLL